MSPDSIAIGISCLPMGGNKLGLFSAFVLEAHKTLQLDPHRPLFVQAKAYSSTLKLPKEIDTPVSSH